MVEEMSEKLLAYCHALGAPRGKVSTLLFRVQTGLTHNDPPMQEQDSGLGL